MIFTRKRILSKVKYTNIDNLLKAYYYDRHDYVSLWANWVSFLSRYIHKNQWILDLGSGSSNKYTKLLASLSDNIIGLDINNAVLENIYLKEAYIYDGERFPFPKNQFDIVISHSTMEHVKNPNTIIEEIARILKPGGYFLSRQPNILNYIVALSSIIPNDLRRKVNNWTRGKKYVREQDFYPTFYRFNTPRTCRSLLRKNGFELKEFSMLEDAPFYHAGNKILFMIMMMYERIVNYSELLSNFRTIIQFAARKL